MDLSKLSGVLRSSPHGGIEGPLIGTEALAAGMPAISTNRPNCKRSIGEWSASAGTCCGTDLPCSSHEFAKRCELPAGPTATRSDLTHAYRSIAWH